MMCLIVFRRKYVFKNNLMVGIQSLQNDPALRSIHSSEAEPSLMGPSWDSLQDIAQAVCDCLCVMVGTEQRRQV